MKQLTFPYGYYFADEKNLEKDFYDWKQDTFPFSYEESRITEEEFHQWDDVKHVKLAMRINVTDEEYWAVDSMARKYGKENLPGDYLQTYYGTLGIYLRLIREIVNATIEDGIVYGPEDIDELMRIYHGLDDYDEIHYTESDVLFAISNAIKWTFYSPLEFEPDYKTNPEKYKKLYSLSLAKGVQINNEQ